MAANVQKIANRYSRALLNAMLSDGADSKTLEETSKYLKLFSEVWQSNKDLRDYLLNPMFRRLDREKVLVKSLEDSKFPVAVIKFLTLLFSRDRITQDSVRALSEAFERFVSAELGVVEVNLETASALGDSERQEIEQRISKSIVGKPTFNWAVEPELLGGIVVRFQGRVLDGSVRGRLDDVERALLRS